MTSASTSCPLVILASARRAGDTAHLVQQVLHQVPHCLVNLLDWPVAPYRYEQDYPVTDTFLHLADLLTQSSALIVATPVYWYSMSSPLKVFLDRFTDLITSHKKLGRQLAGKSMFLLASGADLELPEGFTVPFCQTATYFNMTFVASLYQSNKLPLAPGDFQAFTDKILSIK